MSPEERAKAVVEHFAASLPPTIRPQLESVIARAITRAVKQERGAKSGQGRAAFAVGKVVRIRDSALRGAGNAYPLADGLTDGQEVTIVTFDHGWLTVRDDAGKEWKIYMTNIDPL